MLCDGVFDGVNGGEMIDFKLLGGFGDGQTDGRTDKLTDIGGCRVAFVTENWY